MGEIGGRKRTSLDLNTEDEDLLKAMMEMKGIESKANMLRQMIRFVHAVVKLKHDGHVVKLKVIDEQGKTVSEERVQI